MRRVGRIAHRLTVAFVVVEATAGAFMALMVLAAWKALQGIDWAAETVRVHRIIRAEWIDE